MDQLKEAMLKAGVITPDDIKIRDKKDEELRQRIKQEKLDKIAKDLSK